MRPPAIFSAAFVAYAIACTIPAFGATPSSESPRPWKLSDLASLASFGDLGVTRDKKGFTYSVARDDLANAWYATHAFGVDAMGKDAPREVAGANPALSPDGNFQVLVDDTDAAYTLSIENADDSGKRVLVKPPVFSIVDSPAWSPDGTMIAFVRDNSDARTTVWRNGAVEIDQRDDVSEDMSTPRRHVWVVDVASGRSRDLTRDGFTYGDPDNGPAPAWSVDDRYIVMPRRQAGIANEAREWATIDVRKGSVTAISGSETCAVEVWSTVDDRLASICAAGRDPIGRMDAFVDGKDLTSSLDREALDLRWLDRSSLVVRIQDGMATRLYLCELGSPPRALTPADENVTFYAVDTTTRSVEYVASSESRPEEVFVQPVAGGPRVQVSHENVVASLPPITGSRTIEWTSAIGETLQGLVFAPPGASAKTPLLVYVAGIEGQFNFGFDTIAQYFVSHGYTVFEPNPRGSSIYGAWSRRSLVDDWAQGPMADVEGGIRQVLRLGLADAHRQYLFGIGAGGYSAAWMDTHSDQFNAVATGFGFTDIPMFYALSDHAYMVREYFGDAPLGKSLSLLTAQSPSTYVDRVHTPTMFMENWTDKFSPIESSYPMYRELVDRHVPTVFWRYLDIRRPEEGLDLDLQVARWFARFGGPKIDDTMPGTAQMQRWIGDP